MIISDLAERLSLTVHLLLHSYRLGMVNQRAAADLEIVQKLLSKGGLNAGVVHPNPFLFSGRDQNTVASDESRRLSRGDATAAQSRQPQGTLR